MDAIKPLLLLAVALLVLCCLNVAPVAAQDAPARPAPSPTPAPEGSQSVSPDSADLAITANVTARELHFDVVPHPTVEFTGKPERKTEWSAERQNLPQQVQPGVTYRDIGIRLVITSVFADIDRIVAEALGETAASDDAPANAATRNNDTRANAAAPASDNAAQTDLAPPAASRTPAPRDTRARRTGRP